MGYIMRKYGLEILTLIGYAAGKRNRKKRQVTGLMSLQGWMDCKG